MFIYIVLLCFKYVSMLSIIDFRWNTALYLFIFYFLFVYVFSSCGKSVSSSWNPLFTLTNCDDLQKMSQKWRPAPSRGSTVLPAAVISSLLARDISEQDYELLLQLDKYITSFPFTVHYNYIALHDKTTWICIDSHCITLFLITLFQWMRSV